MTLYEIGPHDPASMIFQTSPTTNRRHHGRDEEERHEEIAAPNFLIEHERLKHWCGIFVVMIVKDTIASYDKDPAAFSEVAKIAKQH